LGTKKNKLKYGGLDKEKLAYMPETCPGTYLLIPSLKGRGMRGTLKPGLGIGGIGRDRLSLLS
jgi:hypothetical protein